MVQIEIRHSEIRHSRFAAGHTQTVRALVLECGDKSSSSTASNNGTTPLYVAASNGHTEMVRALVLEFGG